MNNARLCTWFTQFYCEQKRLGQEPDKDAHNPQTGPAHDENALREAWMNRMHLIRQQTPRDSLREAALQGLDELSAATVPAPNSLYARVQRSAFLLVVTTSRAGGPPAEAALNAILHVTDATQLCPSVLRDFISDSSRTQLPSQEQVALPMCKPWHRSVQMVAPR